jgi:MFS family permease
VVLIGLIGTAISCVAFAFWIATRSVGGAMNGNVSVIATMANEMVVEQRFQSEANLIVLCFNVGAIVEPILGGVLADPIEAYSSLFGRHYVFGGEHGVEWVVKWPPRLIQQ